MSVYAAQRVHRKADHDSVSTSGCLPSSTRTSGMASTFTCVFGRNDACLEWEGWSFIELFVVPF